MIKSSLPNRKITKHVVHTIFCNKLTVCTENNILKPLIPAFIENETSCSTTDTFLIKKGIFSSSK